MIVKEDKGLTLPKSYFDFLKDIKVRIKNSQIKAAVAVNQELIKLHWWIGKKIVEKQNTEKWGSKILEKLCKDIQSSHPGLKGFSRSNIFNMKAFYKAYQKVQQVAGQLETPPDFCLNIPWYHNVIVIEKIKDTQERQWYIKQTIKDPYCFDFLGLTKQAKEKEIEEGLMDHLQKFLLELGQGFAFVGRQVPIKVGSEDYYLDLLFYHIKLKCYFLIELKAVKFKPEFAGQINFYLSAIDDLIKNPDDNPTIGLILCKSNDKIAVEYALRNNLSPIGVANYITKIVESLPDNLKGSLPSIEELEAELENQFLKVNKNES